MYKSDEDKMMSDPNIKWCQSSVIKKKKPKFSRRHYEDIAKILGQSYQNNLHKYDDKKLLNLLCNFFKKDNPNFNEVTFKKAIEKENDLIWNKGVTMECDCKNIGFINNDWLCLECGEKVENPNKGVSND